MLPAFDLILVPMAMALARDAQVRGLSGVLALPALAFAVLAAVPAPTAWKATTRPGLPDPREHNAVLRPNAAGDYETLVHDSRLLWPATLSVADDGHLHVTANQYHRQPIYQGGRDLRAKPYSVFRVPIDAVPVLLR